MEIPLPNDGKNFHYGCFANFLVLRTTMVCWVCHHTPQTRKKSRRQKVVKVKLAHCRLTFEDYSCCKTFTKWLLYFKAGLSVELSIARWTRHEAAHRRTVKLVHPDILGPDSGDLQAHRCGFIMNCQIVEYSVSKKIMQKK